MSHRILPPGGKRRLRLLAAIGGDDVRIEGNKLVTDSASAAIRMARAIIAEPITRKRRQMRHRGGGGQ